MVWCSPFRLSYDGHGMCGLLVSRCGTPPHYFCLQGVKTNAVRCIAVAALVIRASASGCNATTVRAVSMRQVPAVSFCSLHFVFGATICVPGVC